MIDRIKQRLNRTTSIRSTNENIDLNVNFVTDYKELPYNEISSIVNAYEVFSEERNNSDKYRIISTVRLLASNPLIDLTGLDSMSSIDSTLFRSPNPINNDIDYTFEESYDVYFKELDGWFGYYNPDINSSSKHTFIDYHPKRTSFEIVHSADTNWYFYVTFPKEIDDEHELIKGGLLIVDSGIAVIGSIERLLLVTPVKHNLVAGDKVRITNAGGYSGDYTVQRVGYDNGDMREHAFVIDLDPLTFPVGSGTQVRMKRLYYNHESKYYFRKFSAITENNDYEAYNLAYSRNVYGDKVSQIIFNGGINDNSDIEIGDLKDNLDRPLSELYITALKGRPYGRDKSFSKIKSGLEMPFIGGVKFFLNVPDIHRIHDVSSHSQTSHTPIEIDINYDDTLFYGDVVEYNELDLKEVILGEVHHRFNTHNRNTTTYPNPPLENTENFKMGPRPEGYYYKPHHKIQIRAFSTYIEQGDRSTINIPDYATNVGGDRFIWRDLLSLGFNDGSENGVIDYPFVNGAHYLHKNLFLNLMRQDPFNEYNLYYSDFPRDPFGNRPDIDNIDGKEGDYVC